MSLNHLPSEVVLLIAEETAPQPDRVNLARSCRRFYYLLLRDCYTSIHLKEPRVRRTASLVYTLYRKPDLAEAVNHLTLDEWHEDDVQVIGYENASDTEDESYQHLMDQLIDLPDADGQLARLKKEMAAAVRYEWGGNESAWLGLLLPKLENLRSMTIYWQPEGFTFRTLLGDAARGRGPYFKQAFPLLEEVTVYGPVASRHMMPLFKLPAMRRFTGHVIRDFEQLEDHEADSTVTELDLRDCENYESVGDMILACQGLKALKYIQYGHEFVPSHFWRWLYTARTTLEDLWIDFMPHSIGADTGQFQWMSGAFVDFTVLKNLHIRLEHLLDLDGIPRNVDFVPEARLTNVLPRSIETLGIFCTFRSNMLFLVREVLSLLSQKQNCVPHLRKFIVEGTYSTFDPVRAEMMKTGIAYREVDNNNYMMDQMRLACGEVGVEFFHLEGRPYILAE